MKGKRFSRYARLIDPTTRTRCDVTPIFDNAETFEHLIQDLAKPFRSKQVDKVAGLEALGFVLGAGVALKLNTGFVPIRKAGELSRIGKAVHQVSFTDYSGRKKTLEVSRDAILPNERVLLVDDWMETGAQIQAAMRLVQTCGGKTVGVSVLAAEHNKKTDALFRKGLIFSIGVMRKK